MEKQDKDEAAVPQTDENAAVQQQDEEDEAPEKPGILASMEKGLEKHFKICMAAMVLIIAATQCSIHGLLVKESSARRTKEYVDAKTERCVVVPMAKPSKKAPPKAAPQPKASEKKASKPKSAPQPKASEKKAVKPEKKEKAAPPPPPVVDEEEAYDETDEEYADETDEIEEAEDEEESETDEDEEESE